MRARRPILRTQRTAGAASAALLLLGCALALAGCGGEDAGAAASGSGERLTPIAAAEVRPRDMSRQISLSGTVEPRVSIRLASRATGTLRAVRFEEGERVAQGDLLAELDMSEEEAELRRARAQEQEARLAYQRAAALQERGAVSPAEYERARAALGVAESERTLWETRLAFGRIEAPRDAVVTARHVEPGEAVQAQETLFELAALDELVIRLGVSELDVVHVREGQPVALRMDAMPDVALEGRVRRVFPTAEAGSRLVPVEVALPEGASGMGVRAGFLARVNLVLDEAPGVIAVPSSAVGDDDGLHYVYVVRDARLSRRRVELGTTRSDWTEIVSGLEPGEIVLATNPIEMREGQRVTIAGWRG
jgi:membrane fusion protein, multidrug efflux system